MHSPWRIGRARCPRSMAPQRCRRGEVEAAVRVEVHISVGPDVGSEREVIPRRSEGGRRRTRRTRRPCAPGAAGPHPGGARGRLRGPDSHRLARRILVKAHLRRRKCSESVNCGGRPSHGATVRTRGAPAETRAPRSHTYVRGHAAAAAAGHLDSAFLTFIDRAADAIRLRDHSSSRRSSGTTARWS